MKIIFICKHNRFRSKLAEAYFKKVNKNKNITAISRGIFKGIPVAKNVIDIGKKFGLKISKTTKGVTEKELLEADLIIITANDVPISLFKPRFNKTIQWEISDTSQNDKESIEKIAKQIFKKVDELVIKWKQ